MNDSILRGFCEKCNSPIQHTYPMVALVHTDAIMKYFDHEPEPVWFLSSKQMEIIRESKSEEMKTLMKKNGLWRFDSYLYGVLLDNDPILVARILKEAGEKKGGSL